tara:strand:+ start:446 stop:1753 length:1308 start_codon:yes stop_codon:yes gene_type:complete
MSFSNVQQRILEPVFDKSGLRVEFRLPSESAFLSDLRLINIGIDSDSATDEPNRLLGVLGAIKRIAILDGSEQLDAINVATIYNAFRNANQVNDANLSMNRFLKYLQTGYVFQGNYEIAAANGQFNVSPPKITQQNSINYAGGGSKLNSQRAWISLKDMLPFLRSSIVLPTSVFRQMRVVVEFNSSAELQYLTQVSTATRTTAEGALLLADEVAAGPMRDSLMKEFKGVVYRPIESELVIAPAITGLADVAGQATSDQKNQYLLTGANGKKLYKMAIVQTPTDTATWLDGANVKGFGNVGSVAQFKTGVQLIVNGVPKLPSTGMRPSATGSYANRRLAFLNDSWGIFNVITGQNQVALNQPRTADYLADQNLIGQQDYIGILVDENINELQLQYDRTGVVNNAALNQSLDLNCFYEVEKAVVMNSDMTYNVIYTQ